MNEYFWTVFENNLYEFIKTSEILNKSDFKTYSSPNYALECLYK